MRVKLWRKAKGKKDQKNSSHHQKELKFGQNHIRGN
jgi:hypothetical protein